MTSSTWAGPLLPRPASRARGGPARSIDGHSCDGHAAVARTHGCDEEVRLLLRRVAALEIERDTYLEMVMKVTSQARVVPPHGPSPTTTRHGAQHADLATEAQDAHGERTSMLVACPAVYGACTSEPV